MASWKKVIVSGSAAELSSLTLDTQLPVAQGGTGATSLTDGGVLLGSGTGAITATAVLADGEMLVGDGTTDPAIESGATLRTSIGVGTGDSPQFTDLTLTGGDITLTGAATDIDVIDNNASALSIDASGKTGILEIVTTNSSEKVKMSGALEVTGNISGSAKISGSFVGDGSGLTNIAAADLDIDAFDAGTAIHQTQDHFLYSDNGTEKKITFSDVEDAIFGNVSGDATVAAGGALTIANDAVNNNKLANIARGSVKVGGASNAPTDLDAKGDGKILVGDGTDVASVAVSGDVTLANDGAVTIASDAVEGSMIHANAVDDSTLEQNGTQFRIKDAGVDENKLNSSVAGGGLTGGGGSVLAVGAGTGVTVNANDVAIGQSVATTANVTFATASITQDLTVGGDLTVNGTQTLVNTTNLLVEDRFILMNSGSATGDGGFIVQTEAGFTGTALGWDDSAGRFGLQVGTKLAQNATAIAPDAYISSVVTSDDSNYQKNGNIRVQSGDIYIYVE